MRHYRKRPVVIEACRWEPDDLVAAGTVMAWITSSGGQAWIESGLGDKAKLAIATLEGPITASPGDWVVRGTQGEFYPVKPGIFDETYEPAG